MKAASSFRPWSERAVVLGEFVDPQEWDVDLPPFLGESTFPALDPLTTPAAHCLEKVRGIPISRNGIIRLSVAPLPLEGDRQLAGRLCEKLTAHGIAADISVAEEERWPTSSLVIGRASTHPALIRHFKASLLGHPDEMLPAAGEGYLSFRMATSPFGFLGPVAASSPGMATATAERILQLIKHEGGEYFLRLTHEVIRDKAEAPSRLTWPALFESWRARARHPLPYLSSSASPEAMAGHLAATLDAGGPEGNFYNGLYFSWLCEALRYFAQTACPEALLFFRLGLKEIKRHFLSPDNAPSCPSDFNFYIGSLIHEYARWEMLPCIPEAERVEHRATLLALARMVYRYHFSYYYGVPTRASLPDTPRHNHLTFPARELYLAARYFSLFEVPDCEAWCARAAEVFETTQFHRIKQIENANLYEWLAYDHAAAYSLMEYGDLRLFGGDALKAVAKRQYQTVDNGMRPVDFGDADVILRPYEGALSLLRARVAAGAEGEERDILAWGDQQVEHYVESPIWSLTGGRRSGTLEQPCQAFGWEIAPLEHEMIVEHGVNHNPDLLFDKAIFRDGWDQCDLYCCLEGFGNATIPHAHNSLLAVERLTLGGYIWLISNGYGKPCGELNSIKAFRGRELGPIDHNVLVINGGEGPFPLVAERHPHPNDPRTFTATACCDRYEWCRSVTIRSSREVIVTDRIRRLHAQTAWIEWNLLGNARQCSPLQWQFAQYAERLSVSIQGNLAATTTHLHENKEWQTALRQSQTFPWKGTPLCLRLHLALTQSEHEIVSTFSLLPVHTSRPASI